LSRFKAQFTAFPASLFPDTFSAVLHTSNNTITFWRFLASG